MPSPSTPLAVLGVLAVEPSTGYAIRQSISTTIGHFWSESFGQIYPTLATLEAQGFISGDRSEGRRIVYSITPAGLQHLQKLLQEEHSSAPVRDATLLRLFFGRFLGTRGCRELLESDRRTCEAQLDEFSTIRAELESAPASDVDRPFWLMTLRSGELATLARLEWATESLASLDAIAP